jgi:phage tail-like protein
MRGAIPSGSENGFHLRSPHPLVDAVPGVYREAWLDELARYPQQEPFGQRFLGAFDSLLAPLLATIDNLEAYLDPATTPEDFLAWLGEWVAVSVDETWEEDRRRAFVARGAELYRRRGTAAGLKEHLEIHTGGKVEITENGATAWSLNSGSPPPGRAQPLVVVTMVVDDPKAVDRGQLDAVIAASKPAHVPHRLDIVTAASRAPKPKARPSPDPGSPPAPAT